MLGQSPPDFVKPTQEASPGINGDEIRSPIFGKLAAKLSQFADEFKMARCRKTAFAEPRFLSPLISLARQYVVSYPK